MTLTITGISCGPVETNTFLVVDVETQTALIIDAPPDSAEALQEQVRDADVTVEAIVITHGHWDHIADTAALAAAFDAPVVTHAGVVDRITNPDQSRAPIAPAAVDRLVDEGDTVSLGAHTFTVLHLPGHDPGHIALLSQPDRVFLGGDVLFPNGHGRTDLPGTDQNTMNRTLERLLVLADDVVVYPGHGANTTIGDERRWMTALASRSR